ncbi:MAG: toxin-activating lysine-acyltransferase [Pseudomonadota bacterium]
MQTPPTTSHLLGEITWLLTQSKLHRQLPLLVMEVIAMPALLKEQLWIFRDGEQPVGAAFWAHCNGEAAQKLERGVLSEGAVFSLEDWNSGDEIWLVDLVAPFANEENSHLNLMIADLVAGPLKGKAFKFHQTDPATGKKVVVEIDEGAAERLKAGQGAH